MGFELYVYTWTAGLDDDIQLSELFVLRVWFWTCGVILDLGANFRKREKLEDVDQSTHKIVTIFNTKHSYISDSHFTSVIKDRVQ